MQVYDGYINPNHPKGRHMSIFILMAGALIIGGWLMQKD